MTNTEQTSLVLGEEAQVSTTDLVTLDSKTYVAAVYEPYEARLANAIKEDADVPALDMQTKEGLEVATKMRRLFREIRTQGENHRKARKQPITEIGKLIDSSYTDIETRVRPYEDKYDALIKAEEQRQIDIKNAAIKAEEERKAALNIKMEIIRGAAQRALTMTSSQLVELINELAAIEPTKENYDELYVEAETILAVTIPSLNTLLEGKRLQEEQQVRLDGEAKERERTAGIQTKIQAIKNILMDAADCETVAQLQDLITKTDAMVIDGFEEFTAEAEQVKAKTLSAMRRQLPALEAEEAPAVAPVVEQPAVVDPVEQPAAVAEPDAQASTYVPAEPAGPADQAIYQGISDDYENKRAGRAGVQTRPEVAALPVANDVPDNGVLVKLGEIGALLGFNLPGDFIVTTLGFEPAERKGASMIFKANQVPLILLALSKHALDQSGKFVDELKKAA